MLDQEFNLSLQDIAKRLGKAQTTIINSVRLLQLPDFVQQALENREISEGHARSVLALNDMPDKQKELLRSIKTHHWSVRQAELFVQNCKSKVSPKQSKSQTNLTSHQAKHLEKLQKKLGRDIKFAVRPGSINLSMSYSSPDDLDELINKLTS